MLVTTPQGDPRIAQSPERLSLVFGDESNFFQPFFHLEGLLPEPADRQQDGQEKQAEHKIRFSPKLLVDQKSSPEEEKGAGDDYEPPGAESQDVGKDASSV